VGSQQGGVRLGIKMVVFICVLMCRLERGEWDVIVTVDMGASACGPKIIPTLRRPTKAR